MKMKVYFRSYVGGREDEIKDALAHLFDPSVHIKVRLTANEFMFNNGMGGLFSNDVSDEVASKHLSDSLLSYIERHDISEFNDDGGLSSNLHKAQREAAAGKVTRYPAERCAAWISCPRIDPETVIEMLTVSGYNVMNFEKDSGE